MVDFESTCDSGNVESGHSGRIHLRVLRDLEAVEVPEETVGESVCLAPVEREVQRTGEGEGGARGDRVKGLHCLHQEGQVFLHRQRTNAH